MRRSQRANQLPEIAVSALLALLVLAGTLATMACRSATVGATGGGRAVAGSAAADGHVPAEGTPRLVVLIVIDQFGSAEFLRLEPFFTAGLRTLIDQGVVFPRARHEHAFTETGPGHATISTGRYPSHHGVVTNWWVTAGEPALLWVSDDDEYSKSPRKLEVSALGDWLKETWGGAKVFAVSGKARAAVMLGGHKADAAFWWEAEIGSFETSDYYREPAWFQSFAAERWLDRYFGSLWEPLPLPTGAIERLAIVDLDWGPLRPGFPHIPGGLRPAPVETFYDEAMGTPWLDEYVAVLGAEILQREELGRDATPDLLAMSFSAPDYIGHEFGPQSREYVDALMRLDRALGSLLEMIDEQVGLEHVVVALTSDHGVVEVPEVRQQRGLQAHRVDWRDIQCLEQVDRQLAAQHGVERWLVTGSVLAPELPQVTGRSRAELEEEIARALEACPSVEEVWTRSELQAAQAEGVDRRIDEERWIFANSYFPGRSPDLLIRFQEFMMASRTSATTHGSPYLYDREVPVILMAPGMPPGRRDEYVATVDVAPTLAGLLRLELPADVDGRNVAGSVRP